MGKTYIQNPARRGHREGGPTARSKKNSKCHFLRDIEESFQKVTPIGPELHHFFFFLESLNKYGR